MHVVGYQITVGVDDKVLISQERRTDVHRHFLTQEPLLHLFIAPTAHRINSRQTLNDMLDRLRQFIQTWQATLIFLAHHHALIRTHRVLTQP